MDNPEITPPKEPLIQWTERDIYKSVSTSRYTVAEKDPGDPRGHRLVSKMDEDYSPAGDISSQLLLYRLVAVFGMPPANDELDDYYQV
ncbi:Uu.00g063960.m01.CDS01 [Anthostomella pinea]|uniref:Uu.00g063960.m01.CDS01 n=1 Tax=Anthostomella pinea TaxID=933095 RepID=A0AAI8VTG4_9PEZI|nr:Uu.00g063960.m01.CDS01 [Anthostomella pinea]